MRLISVAHTPCKHALATMSHNDGRTAKSAKKCWAQGAVIAARTPPDFDAFVMAFINCSRATNK